VEGQYKPRTTGSVTLAWGRMSSLCFVQRIFDWGEGSGFG